MTIQPQENWSGDLEVDEKLLWQGRPAPPFVWRREIKILLAILALAAVFFVKMLVDELQSQYVHLELPLLMLGGAFGAMLLVIWISRLEHFKTFYAVSDRRAFVAFYHPILGRKVKAYAITAKTQLEYGGSSPGDVLFATKTIRMKHGVTNTLGVGFKTIADASHVFALLKDIQSRQT